MFNTSSVISNDQPTMRPIMKRPQSNMSLKMDSISPSSPNSDTSLPSHHITQAMVNIDNNIPIFGYDNHYCGITTTLLSNPYMCIVNTLAAHARKSVAELNFRYETKKVLKINENAVRLDDIANRWHIENETVSVTGSRQLKEYDDVDLDLFAIHQEAQEFNDCSDLQQKLDFFFLQAVLQHILVYLKESWFDLTQAQRHTFWFLTSPNSKFTIFDHFLWFGYDCIIRCNSEEHFIKATEYNNTVKSILGILSQKIKKDANDLAVDFGLSFSYCKHVIATCNKHFDKCHRNRMPYTKCFIETY